MREGLGGSYNLLLAGEGQGRAWWLYRRGWPARVLFLKRI